MEVKCHVDLEIDLLEYLRPFVYVNFKGSDNIDIFYLGLVAFRGFVDGTARITKMSVGSFPQFFLATSLVIVLFGKIIFMLNLLDKNKHTLRRVLKNWF